MPQICTDGILQDTLDNFTVEQYTHGHILQIILYLSAILVLVNTYFKSFT